MKLNLYELYKNKMFTRSCLFLFILSTFSLFGQNENPHSSSAIKANFTIASIKAYQESATLKIEDYYQYLTLLPPQPERLLLKTTGFMCWHDLLLVCGLRHFDVTVSQGRKN